MLEPAVSSGWRGPRQMSAAAGFRHIVEESLPDGRDWTLSDSCCHVIVTYHAVLTEQFPCSSSSLSQGSGQSGRASGHVLISVSQVVFVSGCYK
jgi:hypothetical protein